MPPLRDSKSGFLLAMSNTSCSGLSRCSNCFKLLFSLLSSLFSTPSFERRLDFTTIPDEASLKYEAYMLMNDVLYVSIPSIKFTDFIILVEFMIILLNVSLLI